MNSKKMSRMKELVEKLNKASKVYYQGYDEIMSNLEYDKLLNELLELEKELGIKLSGSVTNKVGYEVQSKLGKVEHSNKLLSLDKTKDIEEIKDLLGDDEGVISWKLDGLTVLVTYENGELVEAATRGNGLIGEDITRNYKAFTNVPLKIDTKERIKLRGEAIISYSNFEEINNNLEDGVEKYKNPRNLASGSVRHLDCNETRKRNVEYVVFGVKEGFDELENKTEKLECVKELGFETVTYRKVTKENIEGIVQEFTEKVQEYNYPVDGLVITLNNIDKSKAMGVTTDHPKDSIAYKWVDELKETIIKEVFWSNSRTGAINPVAILEPVELDGTTVERASLHNISRLEELEIGVGDIVNVYKANMIIPQIESNKTRSNNLDIPKECPICGGKTKIEKPKDAKVLYCTNKECVAKHIGELNHFTKRDAMDIESLSKATLEKFINNGIIKDFKDIYYLKNHRDKIINMEGFGTKSFERIIKAVERSRKVELDHFLYSLGVVQMGRTTSGLLCKEFDNDLEKIMDADEHALMQIDGIGEVTSSAISKYFRENKHMVRELSKEMEFKEAVKVDNKSSIAGKTFVVTGKVNNFKNRKELQNKIESLGGKVTGSVTSKTDYLINNDINSTSGKNKDAKKLGKPIITEKEFLEMI